MRFCIQYIHFYNRHRILERIQSSVLRWSFLASFWAPLNSTWMVQGCVYVIHVQKSAQPVLMAYAWSIWCTNLLIAEIYIYFKKWPIFRTSYQYTHLFKRWNLVLHVLYSLLVVYLKNETPKFKILKMLWSLIKTRKKNSWKNK